MGTDAAGASTAVCTSSLAALSTAVPTATVAAPAMPATLVAQPTATATLPSPAIAAAKPAFRMRRHVLLSARLGRCAVHA